MKQQILHSLAKLPQLQQHLQPLQFADFCRQLQEDEEVLDARSALELLDLLCHFYWQLENLQKSCFEDVCSVLFRASKVAWIEIIPQLMIKSEVCNNLVFLAQKLLKDLTPEERKTLDKVYPFYWTRDDEYTSITAEEYAYRQAKGLKCWIHKYPPTPTGKAAKDYRRPPCINDFECYYAMLEVLHLSEQENYLYQDGWHD